VVTHPGGAPARVWADGRGGPITGARGPYRLSGAWWEAATLWRREEWDVELAGGGLWRLARTPAGWLAEGEYD
jgi:hypothetical protein